MVTFYIYKMISRSVYSTSQKDTVQHIFDAVDNFNLVEFLELFAQVKVLVVVVGQLDILIGGFWVKTETEMERPVAAKDERLTAVVWVHLFGTDESFKLQTRGKRKVYITNTEYLLDSTVRYTIHV